MVQQIKEYKRQLTMPRTWKGKTKNTFYVVITQIAIFTDKCILLLKIHKTLKKIC